MSGPARGQRAHIAPHIFQPFSSATGLGAREQVGRVVESGDIEPGFGERMGMTPLSTGHIKNFRFRWQAEDIHNASDIVPVTFERKNRLVFQQILRVEITAPPFTHSNPCLEEHRLPVCAEHVFQRGSNLVEGAIRARALKNKRNDIFRSARRRA